MNTDKYMMASLTYRNSVIYPETGRTIAQTLLGRPLRGSLLAARGFFHVKKELIMDREERELLAAKLNHKMKAAFDKGSRVLPELQVGDRVRIQNQTTLRRIRWDKTGKITGILRDRQYTILVDGSRQITVRNRCHLRKI